MIRFLSLLGFVAGGILIGTVFGFAAAVVINPEASQGFVLCGGIFGGIAGFVLGKFCLFLLRVVFKIILGTTIGWVLGWLISLIWTGAPATLPLWCAAGGALYFLFRHRGQSSNQKLASSTGVRSSGFAAATGSDNNSRIRQGDSTYGTVILTIDGDQVRRGDSTYGDVIMCFDGNKVRRGDSAYGTIIVTVDGQKVRRGDSFDGTVIATLDGQKVRQGDSSYGTVIATTEGGYMSGAAAAAFLLLS